MSEGSNNSTGGEKQTQTAAPDPGAGTEKGAHDSEWWKEKAREWESRAKANQKAAKQLEKLQDAQKTDIQKATDAAARHKAEAEQKHAELEAYKLATTNGLGSEEAEVLAAISDAEARDKALKVLLRDKKDSGNEKSGRESFRRNSPRNSSVTPEDQEGREVVRGLFGNSA